MIPQRVFLGVVVWAVGHGGPGGLTECQESAGEDESDLCLRPPSHA